MIAALLAWLPLLLLTLATELAVVAWLAGPRRREAMRVCVAVNLTTHPLATLASWYVTHGVIGIEIGVVAFEWIVYAHWLRLGALPALRFALPANVVSALLGFLLHLLLTA